MIWGGHDCLDSPCSRQLLKYSRGKLTSSVRSHRRGDAIILYPAGYKGVDDRLRGYVRQWNGRWPAREAVHRGQKMATTVGER